MPNIISDYVGTAAGAFPVTAFGDGRTAELTPIIQGSLEYTVSNTELNTNTIANTGTVTQASSMAVIATGTTTASTALFQSKQHARYRAGLGGLMRFTTLFSAPVAGTELYMGIVDEVGSSAAFKNGLAVGYDGATFGFHRFQNDVKFSIAQSSWDDPLDGSGASGMTLDQTKLNVWAINFQYLGAGAMQLFCESDKTGKFVLVHTVHYTNRNTTPSTHNPNYHFTIWAANKGTTSDVSLKCASYAYFIEGKTQYFELHQPQQSSGLTSLGSITSEVAIFTIRNKAQYASKTNFIDALLENVSASIESNNANNLGSVRLVKNATLGGTPSWSDINTSDSIIDMDTSGTTVTGGKEMLGGTLAGKNDNTDKDLLPLLIVLNPGDTLTVAGTSAGSATIEVTMLWKELF